MSEKKQPEKKVRVGRISVSIWRRTVERNGTKFETERVCVQHSSKDKANNWVNQQIWLNPDELRDVANALDELNGEPEVAEETVVAEEVGEKSPSSSSCSMKAHRTVEYIKANSIEADLDVYDVDAMSIGDILSSFGIHTSLASWEGRLVRRELRDYVEKKEFAESAYMAQKCELSPLIPMRRARFGRR